MFLKKIDYFCRIKFNDIMWQDKLGNYLIDISKYVLTGVVISTLFKDFGNSRFLIYGIGIVVSILSLIFGLFLTNKKEEVK